MCSDSAQTRQLVNNIDSRFPYFLFLSRLLILALFSDVLLCLGCLAGGGSLLVRSRGSSFLWLLVDIFVILGGLGLRGSLFALFSLFIFFFNEFLLLFQVLQTGFEDGRRL